MLHPSLDTQGWEGHKWSLETRACRCREQVEVGLLAACPPPVVTRPVGAQADPPRQVASSSITRICEVLHHGDRRFPSPVTPSRWCPRLPATLWARRKCQILSLQCCYCVQHNHLLCCAFTRQAQCCSRPAGVLFLDLASKQST